MLTDKTISARPCFLRPLLSAFVRFCVVLRCLWLHSCWLPILYLVSAIMYLVAFCSVQEDDDLAPQY